MKWNILNLVPLIGTNGKKKIQIENSLSAKMPPLYICLNILKLLKQKV